MALLHPMTTLSQRQRNILKAIYDNIQEKGYPPSVREICFSANIPSTSTVHHELKKLSYSGYIDLEQEKTRALRLTKKALHALFENEQIETNDASNDVYSDAHSDVYSDVYRLDDAVSQRTFNTERPTVRYAPLVGKVTAGVPITAVEHIEDYFPLPEHYFSGKDIFLLRVEGDSMIGAGILHGDLVLVRQQPSAEQGDIVVAMTPEGEATIKRLYWRDETFHLVAENPAYPTLSLRDVTILGKVIGLIRDYEHVKIS